MSKRKRGPACTCRNHLGKPKSQHRSREAAITAIIRRHMRHGGGFIAYPCPTRPGTFHVATERKQQP